MEKISVQAAVLIGVFILGGVGCFFANQPDAAAALLGVAIGVVAPVSLLKSKGPDGGK